MNDRANPAPLGLMGFGMTTVLLNIHNAGIFPMDVLILAMGLFYGGIAQVIAGIMEFRKNNTFGLTAFTSYGLFWLSLVFIISFGGGLAASNARFLGTLKKNRALQVVFLTLTILFVLLAIGHWATGSAGETIIKIAGWEGILCGLSAFYTAAGEVLNETYEKTILPLG